ncbi:hypothetical protein A2975_04140 [Candidatus Woesebacteria bacterium RIFCSPLOWO2_01_FULL_44_14]|uniref:Uncharacterized protein n=1 Tax=Candidatus Woesebacteria bacterium RIFCSPLOWO2_01_FULL_44_14 TaxID=1802525 RepID=A0A1F8C1J6_9BACT|nr:MAG: hypothetical protein A2975_04140 [Candidatus Woesebacteria bacterium RIFCSPLOWO2_01_FULL_44_14]
MAAQAGRLLVIFCLSLKVSPWLKRPRYEAKLSSEKFLLNFVSILRFVLVLSTLWWGKWVQPKKSTPETSVLMKIFFGCKESFSSVCKN